MLVLKRKVGEAILINTGSGDKIEIKISEISDGRVKLGLDAPKTVSILRKEVVEEATFENKMATQNISIDKDKLKDLLNNK
ncbi:carbon storage regulator [Peptoanaerobacter stomatis]|uniref:Translational regulator CsrA n=1 Tax=Peptoanaerobacter stomatis TaxID=796937 RepID=G9X293_9FIRM|nr:carbon storage regulator [Peptoanaerobacter stomatis]EHL13216.1 hypothetical protein HMPREF9629_00516 [Peptoanaerobacter stomatis]EHL20184.1 hypothetical protein HMPREF9628_00029 [Peptoanaerobacter stomatis]